jgi:hypothetical protein
MKQELARRYLSTLMGWDLERARREFAWLDLISRLKYDSYRGYFAGARFVESLLDWLQQFEALERETAYKFVRERLVFVGSSELQHLVELFYPETVRELLAEAIARESGVPKYLVWSRDDLKTAYARLLRQTLFLGISDGARLDTFRRVNVGVIRNEQVVATIEVDDDRWASLADDLRKDLSDNSAQFRFIFLVDDFTGSGLTLLRQEPDSSWKGKLVRFWKSVKKRTDDGMVAKDFHLVVHHYLASAHAARTIPERAQVAAQERASDWYPSAEYRFGAMLPATLPVSKGAEPDFLQLLDDHYNPSIMTPSMKVGGEDGRLGFAQCGLPIVLEHNTPNNTVSVVWAEAEASDTHPEMRPLFRRRQRHL